jgi:hypothetical protein
VFRSDRSGRSSMGAGNRPRPGTWHARYLC